MRREDKVAVMASVGGGEGGHPVDVIEVSRGRVEQRQQRQLEQPRHAPGERGAGVDGDTWKVIEGNGAGAQAGGTHMQIGMGSRRASSIHPYDPTPELNECNVWSSMSCGSVVDPHAATGQHAIGIMRG